MPRSSIFSRLIHGALALAASSFACLGSAEAQTIRNTATLEFSGPAGPRSIASNTVTLDRVKRPTRISFHRVPTDLVPERGDTLCQLDPIKVTPVPITAADLARSQAMTSLDVDDPVIIAVQAEGENHDPNKIETTTLLADSGKRQAWVVLTETGPDTGDFAGAFAGSTRNSANVSPCDITADHTGLLKLSFMGDEDDAASTNQLLIDPEGETFDSVTGAVIDGVTVTLIDVATGQPAQVFGDDGVSAFPSTIVTGVDVTDSGGWKYDLSKGNFRFPLVAPGRYRLMITPPEGYTAPSKRSAEQLSQLLDPYGAPFDIKGASFGGEFDLVDPAPLEVDIPLDPMIEARGATPTLVVTKTASVNDASAGDFVAYSVEVKNVGLAMSSGPVVTDSLPRGLRYRPGTARGAAEPEVSRDGVTLRFALPALAPGAARTISYVAAVGPDTPVGEAVNHAYAEDAVTRSADASAAVRIHAALFTDAMTLIGRVTEGGCGDPDRNRKGVAGVRVVLEDGTFTITDRDGLYHFEGVRPGTHVVQIDTGALAAGYAPVACDRDTRSDKDGASRFVEGQGGSLQRADFQLRRVAVAPASAKASGPVALDDATAAGGASDWLALAQPGAPAWLFPDADHNPRSPSVRAVVQHARGQRVALTLNGAPVEPLSFDGTDEDAARGLAVSRWNGLPLVEGDNRLQARVLDASGATVATLERVVHYANTPAAAAYVEARSQLAADGLTSPQVAVRVTDADGKPVRAGTTIAFRVEQPYAAAQAGAAQQTRQLAGLERSEATARVSGDDGIALIALQPTTQAGTARITLELPGAGGQQRSSEIRPWLSAPARDWMIVGFGKGTIGYQTLSRHSAPATRSHDVVTDGQLAVYAKGRIKGRWLLTLAYDSDRRFDRDRGLLGTIDPDRYYTVYGDGTTQGYDAATRGKLYLRLESRAFYALFGDFETGFTDTKLARYSRTLNGAKAEYSRGGGHVTVFAANVDERYARDEIQGNGLSGPYRLSAQNIVPNSDKLRLETRDRYRSDQVLDSKLLARHIDYDIDPVAGTIRFREPVLSRDAALNPVFIVVDYETYGPGKKRVAGARGAIGTADGKAAFGATVLHDEAIGSATVAAVDVKVRPFAGTELRGEAATGGQGGLRAGQAFSVEAEHHGKTVDLLAYAHQQDVGFGLGQQNLGEAGTRKIGMDGRLRLGERVSASLSAWAQDDLLSDASRIAADGRIEVRRKQGTIFLGGQFASDRGIDGQRRQSQLLSFGGTQRVFGDRLELSAQGQVALGGKDDSTDFPARQQFGASWKLSKDVRLLGVYEIARGDSYTAHAARLGFDVAPWAGGRLTSSINQQAIGENGTRTYAQYGLAQSLPLGKRWTIDATLDASGTLSGHVDPGATVNPFLPRATGGVLGQDSRDGDFVAVTLGANYRGDRWSWNGRAEYRNSDLSRRLGLTSNLLRTLGEGSTLASSITAYRVTDRGGATVSHASADLALAIRPADSRWALLERFELRHERADAGASSSNVLAVPVFALGDQSTLRAINNVAVSYRTGPEGGAHGFEASVYYGAKFVRGRYAGETLDGFVDVVGLEVRKDLKRNLDVTVSASVQHSWTLGSAAFSYGPSLGFSPGGNAWVSLGYNVSGYRDRDFEDTRYTRQGPYLTMRVRLDKGLIGVAGKLFGGK
jgi:uncharacterized repeat protein (TIGR01451 family)